MSFGQILERFSVSDKGETLQKISGTTCISSDGTTYIKTDSTTVGSDGFVLTQMESFSIHGSTHMGNTATAIGAIFNGQPHIGNEWPSPSCSKKDQF